MELITKLIKDRRGYGTAEMMILVALGAAVAIGVLTNLLPSIQNLHSKSSNNIRMFGGSGF